MVLDSSEITVLTKLAFVPSDKLQSSISVDMQP